MSSKWALMSSNELAYKCAGKSLHYLKSALMSSNLKKNCTSDVYQRNTLYILQFFKGCNKCRK